jgi:hypothetical protein
LPTWSRIFDGAWLQPVHRTSVERIGQETGVMNVRDAKESDLPAIGAIYKLGRRLARFGLYRCSSARGRPVASFSIRPPPNRACNFQSTRLSSGLERMMASTVSAFLISSTVLMPPSDHLTHFAMWTAFPPSDYYWVSVARGSRP